MTKQTLKKAVLPLASAAYLCFGAAYAQNAEFDGTNALVDVDSMVSGGNNITMESSVSTPISTSASTRLYLNGGNLVLKENSSLTLVNSTSKYNLFITPTNSFTIEKNASFTADNTAYGKASGEQTRIDGVLDVYGSYKNTNFTDISKSTSAYGFDICGGDATVYSGGSVSTNSNCRIRVNTGGKGGTLTIAKDGSFTLGAFLYLDDKSVLDVAGTINGDTTKTFLGTTTNSVGSLFAKGTASATFRDGSVSTFKANSKYGFYFAEKSSLTVEKGASLSFDSSLWTENKGGECGTFSGAEVSALINGAVSFNTYYEYNLSFNVSGGASATIGSTGSFTTNGKTRIGASNAATLVSSGKLATGHFQIMGGTTEATKATVTFNSTSVTEVASTSQFVGMYTCVIKSGAKFSAPTFQIGGIIDFTLEKGAALKTNLVNFQGITSGTANINETVYKVSDETQYADYSFRSANAKRVNFADGIKMGDWAFDGLVTEGALTIGLSTTKTNGLLISSITNGVADETASGTISFYNFANNYLEILDTSNLKATIAGIEITNEIEGVDYTRLMTIFAYSDEGTTQLEGTWAFETIDGHTYLNLTVPEPSTYAAMFGILALAFAAMRRRK